MQNPTSTAIFKALLSLKTRNALVRCAGSGSSGRSACYLLLQVCLWLLHNPCVSLHTAQPAWPTAQAPICPFTGAVPAPPRQEVHD